MPEKYLNLGGLSTLWAKIKSIVSEKQDALTAGTGITIEGGVISATGTAQSTSAKGVTGYRFYNSSTYYGVKVRTLAGENKWNNLRTEFFATLGRLGARDACSFHCIVQVQEATGGHVGMTMINGSLDFGKWMLSAVKTSDFIYDIYLVPVTQTSSGWTPRGFANLDAVVKPEGVEYFADGDWTNPTPINQATAAAAIAGTFTAIGSAGFVTDSPTLPQNNNYYASVPFSAGGAFNAFTQMCARPIWVVDLNCGGSNITSTGGTWTSTWRQTDFQLDGNGMLDITVSFSISVINQLTYVSVLSNGNVSLREWDGTVIATQNFIPPKAANVPETVPKNAATLSQNVTKRFIVRNLEGKLSNGGKITVTMPSNYTIDDQVAISMTVTGVYWGNGTGYDQNSISYQLT